MRAAADGECAASDFDIVQRNPDGVEIRRATPHVYKIEVGAGVFFVADATQPLVGVGQRGLGEETIEQGEKRGMFHSGENSRMMRDAFAAHHLHGFTAAGHDALEQGRIRLQSLLGLHVLQDDVASL